MSDTEQRDDGMFAEDGQYKESLEQAALDAVMQEPEVELTKDLAEHAALKHQNAAVHHRHSHAEDSDHAGGHHLLQVEHLNMSFSMYDTQASWSTSKSKKEVIHDMNVSVHAGEILAIVGASGAGKTLLADTLMGLFEPNVFVEATIWFDGELQDATSLAALRGKEIALVPQSVAALNPLMKVGKQIVRGGGERANKQERTKRMHALFKRYGLGEEVEQLYPFELSGGMARRVLLCTALMEQPQLIIADEPTPGLDLDLAVKALDDFREFANEGGGVLLITHDIELALRVANRVAVFEEGTVVEETAVSNFTSPDTLHHPFSKALWHALPEHDFSFSADLERANERDNEPSDIKRPVSDEDQEEGLDVKLPQGGSVGEVTAREEDATC